MEHNFKFTDIDCLIILEALNYFIVNKEMHPIDRETAMNTESKIIETVKKDKESNNEK